MHKISHKMLLTLYNCLYNIYFLFVSNQHLNADNLDAESTSLFKPCRSKHSRTLCLPLLCSLLIIFYILELLIKVTPTSEHLSIKTTIGISQINYFSFHYNCIMITSRDFITLNIFMSSL